ncbi:hypothetical protein BHE74_00043292 [Ensete ventricosum]|nr:hypothetical protein BHE74_00043292 [Ensete ventricosum]RZS17484.1 hypothetical protein BHM03_00049642 [Ensete ventricosum]
MFLMNFTTYISTCYAFVPLWFLSSQVCGLKWSYDNFELASGGNDNKVTSGGGTADRCIRLRNTTTNSHSSCIDTGKIVANEGLLCANIKVSQQNTGSDIGARSLGRSHIR